ncbi:BatD family protein [Poseidonibacter lekithochrous]|uniref:BatD family protein n=1 Tax=Poseidonibacter lekithochrous TaxID=1904463 RepID=UPI0008FCA027|nr:BatD family protein [Poseidonibacter lekithochrous]QKJ24054.1 putative aerotolerance protein BatD [Poseidonibacter lekithochrous]
MIRFLIILITLVTISFSNVKIEIPSSIIKGESLLFAIEASGDDIIFPEIKEIDGFTVDVIQSYNSTNIINSRITKKIKKVYSLQPTSDITLPPLEFKIDDKLYITKIKEVKLVNAKKTKSELFDLTIKTNKNDVYVGEDIILTVVFKYKKHSQIVDLSFEQPNFNNFWFKQLNSSKQYEDGNFVVQELNFLLFPLKAGLLEITPMIIHTQMVDPRKSAYAMFSNGLSTFKVYSNALDLKAKDLPSGVDLIGDFDIEAKLDKTKVKKGESISYRLKVDGVGNIDDIKDIKLDLKEATIFENKPKIIASFKDGKYTGSYTKVFSLLLNKNTTIPSVKLSYFNKLENKVITKETKSFVIEVENKNENITPVTLEKKNNSVQNMTQIKVVEKSSIKDNILYFSLGIISTLLIFGLYYYVIKQKEKKEFNDRPLLKKIKASSSSNDLLKILSPFIKTNSSLDKLIFDLEKQGDFKTLKKEIIKLLKQIELKG